ncbi:TIGR03545 family protein [Thiomicrospira sp. ALE5]|uniref:TIGR03545 family protein n=1 Tax=Thiomicrospira sp. ALE5 TaxID=748650 RepID=UPI0008EEE345|nr:TIGR03545 family protein [Thiomicrospira sp. ALE5]SFR54561.1 TIGR03545 family protein [Thiomicrospira sp. ALE5]
MSEPIKTDKNSTPPKKMAAPKGWVRWSGVMLLAGLLLVGGGLTYVVSQWALKAQLERAASAAWGAKVEIASLRFGLAPVGMELRGLAITDTNDTMQNALVIDRIAFDLNLYHLVVGRTVIDQARITGIAFDQPRSRDGALPIRSVEQTESSRVARLVERVPLPNLALPEPDTILSRESLQTLEQTQALATQLEQIKAEWQSLQPDLPTPARLTEYQTRLAALLEGDLSDVSQIPQRQQALAELQAQWQQDQQTLARARSVFDEQMPGIRASISSLPGLPAADARRLMATYTLDEQGLSNITYLLFGDTIQGYLDQGLGWYHRAQPVIEWWQNYRAEAQAEAARAAAQAPARWEGEYIVFTEYDPQPDFMLKTLEISAELASGPMRGEVNFLNFDHATSQQPIEFEFSLAQAAQINPWHLLGQVDGRGEDWVSDVQFNWPDYAIEDWQLVDSASLPVVMQSAQADWIGQLQLTNLDRVDATLLMQYQQAKLDVSQSDSATVLRLLQPIFTGVDSFKVEAGLVGAPWAPRLSASSDLDRRFASGLRQVMQQEMAQLQQQLTQEIESRLAEAMAPLDAQLASLNLDQAELMSLVQGYAGLDQQGDQQRRALERQLQQRAEDEVRGRAEQELRQRLPNPFGR